MLIYLFILSIIAHVYIYFNKQLTNPYQRAQKSRSYTEPARSIERVVERMKQIALRMPDERHKRLRYEAVEMDTNLTQCLLRLLEEALAARHGEPPNPQHVQQER